MKYGLTILFCLYSKMAMADLFIPDGKCIDSADLPFRIVQRLDENTYEMGYDASLRSGNRMLLITKRATFTNPGHVVGIGMKVGALRRVALRNGFEATVQVYEECKLVPIYFDVYPDAAIRKLLKGEHLAEPEYGK